ncbi:MAG: VOC family protein [Planctomycetes bacterium]|nr:VOC family protein [Planctomycetota bacterium]
MRINHIELPVSDSQASKRFYIEKLGFKLEGDNDGKYIWLSLGDVTVLLRPGKPQRLPFEQTHNIVLCTDDLGGTHKKLAARGVAMKKGGNVYYIQDPDGHWFQLVDPKQDHSRDDDITGKSPRSIK